MSLQKKEITKHLQKLYQILAQKNYITTGYYYFQKNWDKSSYNKGISKVTIDLLYSIIIEDQCRLHDLRNAIRGDYCGNIKRFLNGNGFIAGYIYTPRKGIAKLGWDILEKLSENNMDYIKNLHNSLK